MLLYNIVHRFKTYHYFYYYYYDSVINCLLLLHIFTPAPFRGGQKELSAICYGPFRFNLLAPHSLLFSYKYNGCGDSWFLLRTVSDQYDHGSTYSFYNVNAIAVYFSIKIWTSWWISVSNIPKLHHKNLHLRYSYNHHLLLTFAWHIIL